MRELTGLFDLIERVTPEGGDWCTVSKAQTLAAMVVALRPQTVVEIGVWMGGSAIPMALALQYIEKLEPMSPRRLVAIDAWSADASIQGQEGKNVEWWSAAPHDLALTRFQERIAKHELAEIVQVVRCSSETASVPADIGLLHIDGNHGEQAISDVKRFAAGMARGGILVMDDVGWGAGTVATATQHARALGFADLYPLGTGVAMIRLS